MKSLWLSVLGLTLGFPASGDDLTASPGFRTNLSQAVLFVPARHPNAETTGFDLTLHLHGAPKAVEEDFLAARRPGVLANVTLPGLSSAYARHFAQTNVFWQLVRETQSVLQIEGQPPPRLRHLTVTSFSAGFGGVRELLRDATIFDRIDALVMADSLYAGFVGDPADRKVAPANLAGFLRFAREAAVGRKELLVSHSEVPTPTYASTFETADYLIAELGGERTPADTQWGPKLRLTSRFERGQCHILGFAGTTGEDHLQHLRCLGLFLERFDSEPPL